VSDAVSHISQKERRNFSTQRI